jgi:hypothetical protein
MPSHSECFDNLVLHLLLAQMASCDLLLAVPIVPFVTAAHYLEMMHCISNHVALSCVLCRYEFFAPIWRVMRDDNMPVAEVGRQVEAVALAVKQGSSISDMRHHKLTGRVRGAQVRPSLLLCVFMSFCIPLKAVFATCKSLVSITGA